jgi:DNA-binding GntR family transcriptional regulator
MTNSAQLSRVEGPVSLTDRVHHILRQAILSLELKPGDPLSEEEMAKQLGVSKTPVRSAIHRLAEEGLVVKQPYKGVFVEEMSTQKMEAIFQVRAVLEGLAAYLAAPYFTQENIDRSQKLLQKSEQALASGDTTACMQFGKEFHMLIHSRVNNDYLQSLLSNVDAHLQRYRLHIAQIPGRLSKSVQEHQHVLEALKSGDSILAESAMRKHLFTLMEDYERQNKINSVRDDSQKQT